VTLTPGRCAQLGGVAIELALLGGILNTVAVERLL
jgi:hypothetical protein